MFEWRFSAGPPKSVYAIYDNVDEVKGELARSHLIDYGSQYWCYTSERMAWYWPNVYTLNKARIAARAGACVCFCFAGFDAVVAAFGGYKTVVSGAAFSVADVLRLSWCLSVPLFGCLLFAVAGWRIWNFSRAWAVAVLAWYLFQSLRTLGFMLMILPPPILLTFVLVTGVRGVFAYHRLSNIQAEIIRAKQSATSDDSLPALDSTPTAT